MIFDCFTFFNENDLLELRLNYLNDVVDKFIIVEANKTHSGVAKPMYFDKKRYKEFEDKITYVFLEDLPENESSWVYENLQRNYIQEVLKKENAKDDDIIIVSDLDEIPSEEAILKYMLNPVGIAILEQKMYCCWLNLYEPGGSPWCSARIFKYKEFSREVPELEDNGFWNMCLVPKCNKTLTPTRIRIDYGDSFLQNAGWHFSYLGGAEAVKYKIESFAHQEFNREEFVNIDKIKKCLAEQRDILGRANDYEKVEIDESYPNYLRENIDKFKKYILE